MKSIVKLALAFVLGILVTTAIIPQFKAKSDPAPTPEIQAKIEETAVTGTLALAEMKAEPVQAIQESEPVEVEEITEPEEVLQVAETEPASVSEPVREPEIKQTASPPQVTKAEPEYFYEDGKKYAYINGLKTYIAPDDEPAVNQIEFYDWENDPAGQIKGPFN